MGQLSISLLGRFQADISGEPLTRFRTKKAQALLIYLAAESQSVHRREQLMTLLWPRMPESSARANLRQILFHLRQAIPDFDDHGRAVPYLIADRHTIQLNPEVDITIDTAQFGAGLARVQAHEHVELLACNPCYQTLQTTVSLYRGDFLADIYLDDSNEFEQWAEITRQQYRRKALDALSTLTTMAIWRSAFAEARHYAERQIAIDDLHESTYRQLMEILARSGQRAASLALYDSYRRRLAEELGMAPTTRTADLYKKIQAGDLDFDQPQIRGVRGYELKEAIGEGAYGVVHRAVQATIGREVAIKIIRRRYANDPVFIRRFESEAQIIACLEHPHIVPLYDYWRDPDGAYLVLRYMRGGNLLSALEGDPWKPERALRLLEQVAGALSAAHRRGVIHRNIKPTNILLDEVGNAYLSDLSIARDLSAEMESAAEGVFVGMPYYVSPEEILNEPVGPPSDIYSLAILLYEILAGEKPFPNVPAANLVYKHLYDPIPMIGDRQRELAPQIDDVIQRATAKRPADRYADAMELADAFRLALRGRDTARTVAVVRPSEIANPYKGLRPFREADADDFFGRQVLVQQLLARLADSPFLAVVGPSGSGKSSAVRAGLIPALRRGALPGSEKWFVAEMVPGRYPLEGLEKAMWPLAVDPPPSLVEPMERDHQGLLRTIRRILPGEEEATLLLVIDQFEELFTLVDDQRRRDHFIESLLTALTDTDCSLQVVVILRADFYDRPLQQQALGRWLRENTEVVLPLLSEELTAAISQPARRVGVALEESLIAAIVADVKDEPGALPLLQYALTELFDGRQDGHMTFTAYKNMGGVSGALARRAEELFAGLDEADRNTVRQIFLRLVTLGEGQEDTRRRVLRTELQGVASMERDSTTHETVQNSKSKIDYLLDLFGRYRLVTFDRDPVTRGPTVEIAHEALLRAWPRLRRWLDEGREDIRLQRLLADAATEWRTSGREEGYLLRGARLRQFERWASVSAVAVTGEERTYLGASMAARDDREAAAAAQKAREEELESQSRNRLRYLVGVLATGMVVAAILTFLALNFARTARLEARRATSRELAAAAVNNLDVDPERSVLLALAGLDAAYTVEAENALHQALPDMHLLQTLTGHDQIVESLAISPDGDRFASAAYGMVIVWKSATGEPILRISAGSDIIFGMVFSPDGTQLITASEDRAARIWDGTTGKEILHIDHGAPLSDVSVSPDGLRLVTAGADGVARVWDAQNGRQIMALRGHAQTARAGSLHPGGVVSVAFAPEGERIVTGGADGTVRLWDAESGEMLSALSEHTNEVYVALGPDGNRLLTAGFDGQVTIWDISPGKQTPERMQALYHDDQPARAAAFSPDGGRVAVAGQGGAATVWDATSGQQLLRLVGHEGLVDDLKFTLDGGKLVTAAEDKTVKVWDLSPGRERLTIADGYPLHAAYSPNGTQLATAHSDGSIRIRDSASGQRLLTLSGHPDQPQAGALYLTFSPDGTVLASSSWDKTAKLWDVASGAELLTLAGHSDFVWQAAFSPDGTRVATASQDGSAKIWDRATGRELFTLSDGQRQVLDVAYSPDGRRIAVAGCPHDHVSIWDAATGRKLAALDTGTCLNSVAFSSDGKRLAAGRTDGAAIILDVSGTSGQAIYTLTGHTGLIQRLALSHDGERLATASFDGSAKVWNLTTGQEWLTLPVGGWVTDVAFNPDGTELATAGRDGLVRIWVLELDELVSLARSRLTRNLTQEECQKFLHLESCPDIP